MDTYEVLDVLNIKMLKDSLSVLDNNDENYSLNVDKAYIEYLRYLVSEYNKRPIYECESMFFMMFNLNPKMANELFMYNNDKMARSALLFFYLSGIDPIELKNDSYKAINDYLSSSILDNNESKDKYKEIANHLSGYLKNLSNEEINNIVKEDFISFATNFDKVYDVFLNSSINMTIPNRETIIMSLFGDNYTKDNIELLDKIYRKAILNVPSLKSLDYNVIFSVNPFVLSKIKGIFRRIGESTFDELLDKSTPKIISNMIIKDICNGNKDDEEGLKWFLSKVNERAVRRRPLDRYLTRHNEFYRDFKENNKYLYDNIVVKLINGDIDIDEKLLENLGFQDAFLANYDYFLDIFLNTDDKAYQKALIIPLTIGLVEKECRINNLDISVDLTAREVKDNSLGHYNHEEKEIYINPAYLACNDDYEALFAVAVDTVFHETKHALQYKQLEKEEDFDYNNLLKAMDDILSKEDIRKGYYTNNYDDLLIEKEANKYAYSKSIKFFENHPRLFRLLDLDEHNSKNKLPNYLRKESKDGIVRYYSVVDKFMENINSIIGTYKEYEADILIDDYIKKFDKYPVIKQFFDIDSDGISPKSEEYFEKKKKEFDEYSSSPKKYIGLYSIEAFKFALKVGEYLRDNDSNISKIDDEIGKGPVR